MKIKLTIDGKEQEFDLTLEQYKQLLADNENDKEFQDYLLESTKAFLETEPGIKIVQPKLDAAVTKGIDGFKEKTLPGLIKDAKAEAVKEANPEETPLEKEVRELKEEQQNLKKENFKKDQVNLAITMLTGAELTKLTGMAEKYIGDTEEATRANVTALIESIKGTTEDAVKKALNGRKPKSTDITQDPDFKNPFSPKYFDLTKQGQLWKDDPELAKKLKAEAASHN